MAMRIGFNKLVPGQRHRIAKVRLVRSAAANQPGNKANAPSALRPLISGTMHFNMVQPIDPDFPFNRI